jgi:Tfp pilus assembly protein PilW
MLTPADSHRPPHAREAGFTLVETLVAMMTGLIVVGALFAILELTTQESARITDVAQATQLGRTTMTHVIDEMHSACVSANFTPVQEKSSAKELILANGYSENAEVPSVGTSSTGVRKDKIVWNELESTLTDFTYLSTGSKGTNEYTFSEAASPAKGVLIGENVKEAVIKGEAISKGVFGYFKYATTAAAGTAEASSTLTKIEPGAGGLTAAQAKEVSGVLVTFNIAPTNKLATGERSVNLSSQVTFAFSAPSAEATIVQGPCE